MDHTVMKALLTGTIPWVKMSDIHIDVFEPRWVKLSVPVKQKHLNHVGMVYSATQFMLMEVSGAALFVTTYGTNRFTVLTKEMSINYLRPAYSDIACELMISEEEAAIKINRVEERGKGGWSLEMSVTDTSGMKVSTSICNYFLMSVK